MAVVINGKVFVDGMYVGKADESIKDGTVLDVAEHRLPVYVIGGGEDEK